MTVLHMTKTQARLLELLAGAKRTKGVVVMSKADMAKSLNVVAKTVDRAFIGLKENGLVEVVPRYAENGGQLANGYKVTRKGTQYRKGEKK